MSTTQSDRVVSPELAEAVLQTLLRMQDQDGFVSNADVRHAAEVLGCTPRTVRRMIARGAVARKRCAWEPSEDLTALIVESKGSIAETHSWLRQTERDPGCSKRTMQRWAARAMDQRVLAGARGGYEALRAHLPMVGRQVVNINDSWATDHTLLPVWTVLPDGSVVKPWLTSIVDEASRLIVAFTVTPHDPSVEEDVETLASAGVGFTTEDGVFIGGTPLVLRSDRGGDFISRAMTQGLISQDIARAFTEAYTPEDNGRIERWHKTLKNELCCHIEGFDRRQWTVHDPRKEAVPPPRSQLLPLATVTLKVVKWMQHYNFERPHGSLPPATSPYEFWKNDDTEIVPMDEVAIRAAMTQQKTPVVTKGRVRWDNRFYVLQGDKVEPDNEDSLTWRAVLERKKVQMRYLDSRYEYVEVYTLDGQYATKAVWNRYVDEKQAADVRRDRRQAIRTLRAAVEDIAAQNVESKQALIAEARAEAEADDDFAASTPRRSRKDFAGQRRSKAKKPKSAAAKKREEATKHQAHEDRSTLQGSVLDRTGTDDFI